MTASRRLAGLLAGCLAVTTVVAAQSVQGPVSGSVRASALGRPTPMSIARVSAGGIQGTVSDDHGAPLVGAMVSALGSTTAFAVTDPRGRFDLQALPPGAYLVRAHMGGFVPSRARIVEVMPAGSAVSTIALHRAGPGTTGTAGQPEADVPVMTAGFAATPDASAADTEESADDHSETAWRLRHIKRSVLKDTTIQGHVADDDSSDPSFQPDGGSIFGRAMESSMRLASMFSDLPITGQINLLTSSAFDSPLQLFSADGLSHNVAYMSIGAPAAGGDLAVRGAMTQGDVASWILAGSYMTRAPASHAYRMGMSYSMQRYDGGNPVALAAVTDGMRNVGAMYGFDHWTVSRALSIDYGAGYARYDYVGGAQLFSPRLSATVTPVARLRLNASVSRQTLAPGAEEFVPPTEGVWLPPERTFSSLSADARFRAERSDHYEVGFEHDLTSTDIVGFRTFYQRVDDQLVTLFGMRAPEGNGAELGHYYTANNGGFEGRGWGVTYSHDVTGRLQGSIDYTVTDAVWIPSGEADFIALWSPSAVRRDHERVHDLTTSVRAEIPETATRVFVLYRINSAYASNDVADVHPGTDARFDVQINQSLPFLNFTSTQWEMLVAVRNLFRDPLSDGSVYDELLVVRPPKRIVGGLMVRF